MTMRVMGYRPRFSRLAASPLGRSPLCSRFRDSRVREIEKAGTLFPRSSAYIFACLTHPYNLRAWNKLDALSKLLFCQSKPIAFSQHSLPFNLTFSFLQGLRFYNLFIMFIGNTHSIPRWTIQYRKLGSHQHHRFPG